MEEAMNTYRVTVTDKAWHGVERYEYIDEFDTAREAMAWANRTLSDRGDKLRHLVTSVIKING